MPAKKDTNSRSKKPPGRAKAKVQPKRSYKRKIGVSTQTKDLKELKKKQTATTETQTPPIGLESVIAQVTKRTVGVKANPQQINTFARISLFLKQSLGYTIGENEFQFLLATAIQGIHGEIASIPDILSLESIDEQHYRAVIKFKTIHYTRVVTSLILFGQWRGVDCRIELDKLAQSPCFLSFI